MWKRYVLGAVLVLAASASATGVAAFHEIDKVVNAFKHGNTIELPLDLAQADNGKPQTILLIGADQRAPGAADFRAGARSDTMMLVRLDPSKRATALMSIPRDLKVHIPGHGVDKLNAAYTYGGVKLTVALTDPADAATSVGAPGTVRCQLGWTSVAALYVRRVGPEPSGFMA